MQTRLIFDFLPAYARNGVPATAPTCFAALRPAQVFDEDLAPQSIGVEQRSHGRALAGPGEGMSMLFPSQAQAGDTVLIRSGTPEENRELAERISLISEHLGKSSIAVGRAQLVADVDRALADAAAGSFLCAATFGSAMVKVLNSDKQAIQHRGVIRTLLNKIDANRIAGQSAQLLSPIRVLDTPDALEEFLRSFSGPWIIKAAIGAAGNEVAVANTVEEARTIWKKSRETWGSVLGESVMKGDSYALHYVIDPSAKEPRSVIATMNARDGAALPGNVWEANSQNAINLDAGRAIASRYQQFARDQRGSVFYVCQGWIAEPWRHIDTNPRIGASTPLAIFLARSRFRPKTIKNLFIQASQPVRAKELLSSLSTIEATAQRSQGVLVYSIGDHPFPHILAMVIDDQGLEIENDFHRRLVNLGLHPSFVKTTE